jgi:hypothetical protein
MSPDQSDQDSASITAAINELQASNENGEIDCLITIAISPDGNSTSLVRGSANNIQVLGLLAMLKAHFVNSEIARYRAEQDDCSLIDHRALAN